MRRSIGTISRKSEETNPTYCHWKGFADYYDIVVDGAVNKGAAWCYATPYDEAAVIDNHCAFWNGVEVIGTPEGRGLVEQVPSVKGNKSGWEALCWLIRHSEKTTLTAAHILEETDIPEAGIEEAWQVYDVQRYATRYKWRLAGGNGEAIRLEKTE